MVDCDFFTELLNSYPFNLEIKSFHQHELRNGMSEDRTRCDERDGFLRRRAFVRFLALGNARSKRQERVQQLHALVW